MKETVSDGRSSMGRTCIVTCVLLSLTGLLSYSRVRDQVPVEMRGINGLDTI